MRKLPIQLFLLLTLCAIITLPNIATQGLSSSEGHRVIPALEMLDTNNHLVPHMFSQPYVRKPQLVPWIFAAALSINPDLPPELPTRIASALAFALMVFASFFFARAWFGKRAGFPAAIALALTPLYWSPARAAEIESIHNLFSALGAWITLHLLLQSTKHKPAKPAWSIALGATALLMLLTKGPAGFPIFLALITAQSILTRSYKPLIKPTILLPIAIATALFLIHWSNTLSAAGPTAITQTPSAFMFEPGRIPKLLGFIPVSLLTALPLTLALLFPWGKDAHSEADSNNKAAQLHTAKLIALSIPLALLIMNITGVSNDRYAQPILTAAAPLVGWLLTINLLPNRKKILRALTLGSPTILATILLIASLYLTTIYEPNHPNTSGKPPAQLLAQQLAGALPPNHYTLVADAMIEARPETLLYLNQSLQSTPHQLTIHWVPKLDPQKLAQLAKSTDQPLLALLRTDQNADESNKVLIDNAIATGTVHEFRFTLVTLDLNTTQN
ncbi:MAG: glycosyltransferase family 39 protein [Phycisphaerales bacterium]|nr:glycosyltransferase family 39 protein [Phycisphaerales bacterium]